jgi:hypothetical protein
MMHPTTVVVINEYLEKGDVTFAAKPRVPLKAVPYGSFKRQLVRQQESVEPDAFAIYEATTNIPAEITGMALFLTISNAAGVVSEVKGKVNSDIKGLVSFRVLQLDTGFYSYEVSVRANNYYQVILDGSYVVQA